MTYLENFSQIERDIESCMQCGNCQAVCPLYRETLSEASVARGKVQIAQAVLSGKIDYNSEAAHIFDACLTCRACVENCPCDVQVDKIVLAARAAMVKKKGLPIIKRPIFKVLKSPSLFKAGLTVGAKTQGMFFKTAGREGMKMRIPVSGLLSKRVLPRLSKQSFLSTSQEFKQVEKAHYKVMFFTGCMANFVYPQASQAVLDIMDANQVEVIIPAKQHCCGFPVMAHGDTATFKEMAKSHIDIFKKYNADYLITVCGTCGESFHQYYPEILKDDPEYAQAAAELGNKTRDIADFLLNILKFDRSILGPVRKTVTFHQPCHIGRGLNVGQEHLDIISAIPEINFRPMNEADKCCGGAGSFSITHYDLSQQVLKRKLDNIEASGAETVTTACGSCRMQITEGMTNNNMHQDLIYTVELLAESYRNGKEPSR